MLLYRPILSAYKQTGQPAARRYLLREFASPQLHAEPEELLAELAQVREVTCVDEPARLAAEMALRERRLRLDLSTRDATRETGGMWTAFAESRALIAWMQSRVDEPALARGAGAALGATALVLARTAPEPDRVLVLAALGLLGPEVATDALTRELASGAAPGAAALGLSRLGAAALEAAIPPAVQARGLPACAPWLGPALAATPAPGLAGLLERLARSDKPEVREQAALAVGSLAPDAAQGLLSQFDGERDRFVRLHVIHSLARLGVPGGRATLRRFYSASDPELVRVAVIRAAGRSTLDEVRAFLERTAAKGSPEEVAETLQALVCLGANQPEFVQIARAAARSTNPRLMLHGLLALGIWAPDEAFACVRKIFGGPPSAVFFVATYVLRYLRTDQTVSLLQQLLKAFRRTELEEIVVSALCRHLDQPGALATLLALARAGAPEPVYARMMTDLARHLPEDHAAEAAEAIRGLLKPDASGPLLGQGPMLVALGSLGTPGDLGTLTRFLDSPVAEAAIRGIELLMQTGAVAPLEALVRGRKPATRAALVALFRLGHAGAADQLGELSAAADDVPEASRALVEILLSVPHARTTSRLAHLYAALSERARTPAAPGERAEAGASGGAVRTLGAAPEKAAKAPRATPDLEAVLERPRRPVAAEAGLPSVKRAPQEGTGRRLYSDLGQVFRGEGKASSTSRALIAVGVCSVLAGCVAGLAWWHYTGTRAPVNLDEVSRFSRYPPLYREAPGEPEDNAVHDGDLIEGTRDAPVKLITRIKDDMLEVRGKLKAGEVEFSHDVPPVAKLKAALVAGTLVVDFPRGTARIVVEGARTTVEVEGAAELELKESTFTLAVKSGKAHTFRGNLRMKTLTAGQAGEFLDGTPMGRVEGN